jgi:hypothetical protein
MPPGFARIVFTGFGDGVDEWYYRWPRSAFLDPLDALETGRRSDWVLICLQGLSGWSRKVDWRTVNRVFIGTSVYYAGDSAARLATTLLPFAVISYT